MMLDKGFIGSASTSFLKYILKLIFKLSSNRIFCLHFVKMNYFFSTLRLFYVKCLNKLSFLPIVWINHYYANLKFFSNNFIP